MHCFRLSISVLQASFFSNGMRSFWSNSMTFIVLLFLDNYSEEKNPYKCASVHKMICAQFTLGHTKTNIISRKAENVIPKKSYASLLWRWSFSSNWYLVCYHKSKLYGPFLNISIALFDKFVSWFLTVLLRENISQMNHKYSNFSNHLHCSILLMN